MSARLHPVLPIGQRRRAGAAAPGGRPPRVSVSVARVARPVPSSTLRCRQVRRRRHGPVSDGPQAAGDFPKGGAAPDVASAPGVARAQPRGAQSPRPAGSQPPWARAPSPLGPGPPIPSQPRSLAVPWGRAVCSSRQRGRRADPGGWKGRRGGRRGQGEPGGSAGQEAGRRRLCQRGPRPAAGHGDSWNKLLPDRVVPTCRDYMPCIPSYVRG